MGYNSFCPVAKAMEVLGEKWTLLIIVELLGGSSRFNEIQRGLPTLSPTLLTKRLGSLESEGLIAKRRVHGQRSYEYFPTEACQELAPVVEQVGIWGMRWARHNMGENDYDLDLLMVYLERSIQPDKLIGNETVIRFNFNDVTEYQNWWIVVTNGDVEVCIHDPGKEVDVYFNVGVRVMCNLWMGDISYKQAIKKGDLELVGPTVLTRNVERWLKPNVLAGTQRANAIMDFS